MVFGHQLVLGWRIWTHIFAYRETPLTPTSLIPPPNKSEFTGVTNENSEATPGMGADAESSSACYHNQTSNLTSNLQLLVKLVRISSLELYIRG